ncbi:MAG: hypothetical protein ACYSUX_00045 [Planctomycetota bacterium]|jgi:translation elongation factor EF-G
MKAAVVGIEDKVDRLLACLKQDVQHMQESLLHLNEIRRLVIKRDEAALGKLLESIQAGANSYRNHELKRKSIRNELAESFGCEIEQMTLSTLQETLPAAKKDQVTQIKAKLRSLSAELKNEYLSTTLLLSECVRFNNLLLKGIFDFGKTQSVQYNCNGETKRQIDTAFVNLQI